MSALILPRHSYAVGNCQPGTAAWMDRHGLAGRVVAPLHEVYRIAVASGEQRAILACQHAALAAL